ncbi:MAG: radical SAM protein [Bryobacterales bacterium]|jgi:MoaA/NifB/PqqE/SkfB family radical SAM enzyme|nr:radical SAM protein [Bryobacterales bacterium]
MPGKSLRVRRVLRAVHRRLREHTVVAQSLLSTSHPVMAHIIPMRRCNLACTYCNEFDDFSPPVPLDVMKLRLDLLARLGTKVVSISGGEPLLHPQLDEIIAHTRQHGMMAGMITNGYLLVPERIRRLNRAGLEHLQISIDNVMPDEVSKKSLKVLDKKLQMLADHAEFHVNINSVVGGGIHNPQDALVVGRRAIELGFTSTVGIIHDGEGQLEPLRDEERDVYLETKKLGRGSYGRFNFFQDNIAHGRANKWRCRAGARYLYICEDGLVHYCSQQRGYPGKPLELYTKEDIRREFLTEKSCAPYCTVACVHYTSYIDFWRAPQTIAGPGQAERTAGQLVQIK